MKKYQLPLAIAGLLLLAVGCRSTVLSGAFVAAENLPESRLERLSDQMVYGESCVRRYGGVTLGQASYDMAYRTALQKAPEGTSGLADVFVGMFVRPDGLLAPEVCYVVQGIPARLRAPAPAR